jgi:hypothetical protein
MEIKIQKVYEFFDSSEQATITAQIVSIEKKIIHLRHTNLWHKKNTGIRYELSEIKEMQTQNLEMLTKKKHNSGDKNP